MSEMWKYKEIKFSNVIMWQYGSFSGNMSALGNAKMWKYSTFWNTQVVLVCIHQSSGKTATQKILGCQELNLKTSFKTWAFEIKFALFTAPQTAVWITTNKT